MWLHPYPPCGADGPILHQSELGISQPGIAPTFSLFSPRGSFMSPPCSSALFSYWGVTWPWGMGEIQARVAVGLVGGKLKGRFGNGFAWKLIESSILGKKV